MFPFFCFNIRPICFLDRWVKDFRYVVMTYVWESWRNYCMASKHMCLATFKGILGYKITGRPRVRTPMSLDFFFFKLPKSFQLHYGPGVDSTSNRNEYQESSWGGKGRLARKTASIFLCSFAIAFPEEWPPVWSSGQSFWLQIQRSQVRFPDLPDFLRSRGVWNGVHAASWWQLRSYLNEKVVAPV
jgi:hypothetical protein